MDRKQRALLVKALRGLSEKVGLISGGSEATLARMPEIRRNSMNGWPAQNQRRAAEASMYLKDRIKRRKGKR